jgi:hypothetical protein
MRKPLARRSAALVCAAAWAALPAQAGTAVVQFDNPDRYTDIGPRREADAVQQQLRQILQALAAERLPASQTLQLAITDVDLAGEIPPATRLLHDVRVMGNHPDWPRISLRYTLQDGDRLVAEGSEVVTDMAYLQRSTRATGSHPLHYEQRMLSDWFDRRFGKRTVP